MYDLLDSLIGHTWQTGAAGNQQYLYYGSILLAVISLVGFVRLMIDVVRSFWRRG